MKELKITKDYTSIEFGSPIKESQALWEEGKVEKLCIYGTSTFLIRLMERLANEDHKKMHSMELLGAYEGEKRSDG